MEMRQRLRRLAGVGSRFLVVGAISTVIEVGVFNLLHFGWGWGVVSAKVVASLVALVNAYVGNREWAFKHRDRRGRTSEIVLFLVTNAVCTALGAVIVWAGVGVAEWMLGRTPGGFAVNLVNLVSIAIVVLFRFVFYHKVVFRPSRPAAG